MNPRITLLAALLAISPLFAANESREVITFDRVTVESSELFYDEDNRNRLYPVRSYVDLVNFRPMSSTAGNRFALVTLKNQLNSRLLIEEEQYIGIFADGTRQRPYECDESIDPADTRSLVLRFGYHRYPLVKILIDNN